MRGSPQGARGARVPAEKVQLLHARVPIQTLTEHGLNRE